MKISDTIAVTATAIAIAAAVAALIHARIVKGTARAAAAAAANPIQIGMEAITRQVLVPPPHPPIIIHVAKIKSNTEAIGTGSERENENGKR